MFRRKSSQLLLICGVLVTVMVGCNNASGGEENTASNNEAENLNETEDNTNDNREPVDTTVASEELGEAPEDQGDLDSWWEIEVEEQKDRYVVNGQSNLLPETTVRIRAKSDDYTFVGYDTTVDVEEDGSFETELQHPQVYDTEIVLEVSVGVGRQSDEILAHYGESLELIEGPFRYVADSDEEEKVYELKSELAYVPEEGEFVTLTSQTPEWDFPEDQGDLDVWIDDVEVERDDERFYVSGRTNLEEGAYIYIEVELPDYISFGYSNVVTINPDGTFAASINYPDDIDEEAEMNLVIEFKPYRHNQLDYIVSHYGESGENLTGELVEEESSDENYYIHFKLNVQ
ncbi:hypothetical protein HXA34_02025 [Salipaludibacillus agaradhaerens]|uniref:hypothetical protein n=1 Tax=Salipaludibacillus agaradhaerens TaxID=76935 RepID=UPI002150E456|nr:hypothetical protein [Salipaludibacillus agaradhaerens]MCR6105061.1 hypothetical protein [Salipaludibacillus agaradhaerens]MCR6117106.1 hypothetical protein [Salipaludibacillus agaradhaerens]